MRSIRPTTAAVPAALAVFLPAAFALPQSGAVEAEAANVQEILEDVTEELKSEAEEAFDGLEALGEDLPQEGMGSESIDPMLDDPLTDETPEEPSEEDVERSRDLLNGLINYTDGATLLGTRNSLDGNFGGGLLHGGAFRPQNIGGGRRVYRGDGEPESFMDAFKGGISWADFRYRLGGVEARGFPDRSWPSTLRTAVGHETQSFKGFRALGEIEAIVHLFNPSFNDTTGGSPNRAPVPDPEDLEINQLFVAYDGVEGLDARLGRQEIELGNQRFVGSDPWRQNNQSFDALRVLYRVNPKLKLDYTLGLQVNRVVGSDSPIGNEDMNTHLLDARYSDEDLGNFAGYAYLVDFDDSGAVSTNTFGLRYDRVFEGQEDAAGSVWREMDFGIALEYAKQTDAGDNPFDVDADYLLVEGSADFRGYRMSLASETLGGSGRPGDSFSTPLGSLHWFNGFADAFLATPDAGLNDRRFAIERDFQVGRLDLPIRAGVSYHFFDSDSGSLDYGKELDLDVRAALTPNFTVGVQYADFNGDEVFRNINRLSVWAAYRLAF